MTIFSDDFNHYLKRIPNNMTVLNFFSTIVLAY